MATIDKNAAGTMRYKSSRLSLKAQKQLSDISPAPVPRSSHRIRRLSTDSEEKTKTNSQAKRLQNASTAGNNPQAHGGCTDKNDLAMRLFNGFTPSGKVHGICPLANLGNTCFLNSVLYALRFLPGFVHDLHHLYSHLKISSNLDLSSSISQRMDFMTELHHVFSLLRNEEHNSTDGKRIPALHPKQFLDSVRSVNPLFEGNRQQDAHELLHCLLDQLFNLPQDLLTNEEATKMEKLKPPKSKRRKKESKSAKDIDASKAFDVVGSKFVGQMSLETRCVECEQVNSREENFLEVCVPVKTKVDIDDEEDVSDTEVLLTALCTEDSLSGSNKYWCDFCCHHNEAERFVHYKQLPRNLLIHVKRFSSSSRTSAAAKCCDAMPAPFKLPCFCYQCRKWNGGEPDQSCDQNGIQNSHVHQLYSNKALVPSSNNTHLPYFLTAFVCHLGANIMSGHYISFVHVNTRSFSSCLEKNVKRSENADKNSDVTNDVRCSFLRCCSSHLDRIISSAGITNGVDESHQPVASEGIWLECDDEKIRVVSYSEVSAVMNSNHLTPYLLFYSR